MKKIEKALIYMVLNPDKKESYLDLTKLYSNLGLLSESQAFDFLLKEKFKDNDNHANFNKK